MSTANAFKVRALNPDNIAEIKQVIALARRAIANTSHSSADVSTDQHHDPTIADEFDPATNMRTSARALEDSKFWRRQAGAGLVTMLCSRGSDLVAQVSYRKSRHVPGQVELLFPMFALPEGERLDEYEILVAVARELRIALHAQASRAMWRQLVCYASSNDAAAFLLASEIMEIEPCAIVPIGHAPATHTLTSSSQVSAQTNHRHDVAVFSINFLAPSSEELAALDHLPAHRAVTSSLLRQVCFPPPIKSRAPHLATRYFRRQRTTVTTLGGCLLHNRTTLLSSLLRTSLASHVVRLSLNNPECAALAEALERHQFAFCGVLPAFEGECCAAFVRVFPGAQRLFMSALIDRWNLARYLSHTWRERSSTLAGASVEIAHLGLVSATQLV